MPEKDRTITQWSVRTRRASAVLGLIALSLLVPKLFLVDFFRGPWLSVTAWDLLRICLQDLAVAVIVMTVLDALLASARPRRFAIAALFTAMIVSTTLLDARVRQLWLQPTSIPLIRYGLGEGSHLGSGLPLFFNLRSSWGMTFRRALVLLTGAHLLLWCALILFARHGAAPRRTITGGETRRLLVGTSVGLILLVVAARAGGRYRYDLQDHLLTRGVVGSLRGPEPHVEAADFDQPTRPAREVLGGERLILRGARPFRSVVIVLLESVRWRDFAGQSASMPALRRLAREGLVSQCYAPVPHSSKGYYAVLSGRYPYPGIEMREVFALDQPGVLRSLRERKGLETFVFASLSLAFENTGGLLRSLGARHLYQTADLASAEHLSLSAVSSFGTDDAPLYRLAASRLATVRAPFAAVFLPTAAHYPYDYPGKPAEEGATHVAYLRSLEASDRLVEDMVAQFTAAGLVDDTLFVFVGDHGESFGEHGVTVHNSSLYEEEVTVPLVFWSADGRLAHAERLAPSRQVDLAPTILDLLGDTAAPLPVQGVSVLRTIRRPAAYLATFIDGVALGIADQDRKYIYEVASDRLLGFDLTADPLEQQPELLDGVRKAGVLKRLRAFAAHQRLAFPEETAATWSGVASGR